MKKILILAFSKLHKDPRVLRQIEALKDTYYLHVAGLTAPDTDSDHITFHEIRLPPPKTWSKKIKLGWNVFTKRFENIYWQNINIQNFKTLNELDFDCIIANDIDTLPLAAKLKGSKRKKILFDAHEYAPAEFDDRIKWKIFFKPISEYFCEQYLKEVDAFTTVSAGIAQKYMENYSVNTPVIIENSSKYHDLKPTKVDKNKIRLIHHGACIRSRRLELMIEVAQMVNHNIEIDLMLVPNEKKYYKELKKKTTNVKNISIIPPVEYDDIVPFLNKYDIGIFLLPFTNINYKYALPNKFFEFIQARLAIVIGPSPEMADYVERFNLGIVTRDFKTQTVANQLNKLTVQEINQFKTNADRCAYNLSFEKIRVNLKKMVEDLVH